MKNKLLWILTILLAGALFLFENNAGTLAVMLSVILIPLMGLLTLPGGGVHAQLQISSAQEKGQTTRGMLVLINTSCVPRPHLTVKLLCRNLRTGERSELVINTGLLPKAHRELPFEVTCAHCGRIEVTVSSMTSSDVFGLFTRIFPCKSEILFTVLPQLFDIGILLNQNDMAAPDSDSYSSTRPGSDPGETFAIREYVPGDAVKQIHWKLSEKTDRLMVREFGLPVVNEVALLLETSGEQTAEETDALTEVFASISSAMAGSGIDHHVFWRDRETDELCSHSIASGDDFSLMLQQILELPPKEDGSVIHRFLQYFPRCPYSHVIIVSAQLPQGVRNLYNGNRVSVILLRHDAVVEGLQPDGTRVLPFSLEHYAVDLLRLEV